MVHGSSIGKLDRQKAKAMIAWLAGHLVFFVPPSQWANALEAPDAEQSRVEYIQKALKEQASPVPGRRMIGSGTGFFVAPQRVLTAHHVVASCAALTVRGSDGNTVIAQLVADEQQQDLALISTDAIAVSIAAFRETKTTRAGEAVAAIGYPDQGLPRIEPFLATGTIGAADRRDSPARFIIRADVRPGNSGGPVLDERGQVVGVVTAKIDTVRVYQRTGKVVENVGFAIATGPVLQFLRKSGIQPAETEPPEIVGIGEQLLAKGKDFTIRVGCWR
jgi:serine protease Do